jgi:hypothetical protein
VYDVLKDEWRRLTDRPLDGIALHPSKPWVAMTDGSRPYSRDRVVVVDYQSGEWLFTKTFSEPVDSLNLRFIPTVDGVVAPMIHRWNKLTPTGLQVWRIGRSSVQEEHPNAPRISSFRPFSVSQSGSVLVEGRHEGEPWKSRWVDVYDFNEKRWLSTLSPEQQQTGKEAIVRWKLHGSNVIIAPSGESVLRLLESPKIVPAKTPGAPVLKWGRPGMLIELESGRTIWKTSPHESVLAPPSRDSFLVYECWHDLWDKWFPNLQFETHARRSLDTGQVLYRTPSDVGFNPQLVNSNQTLVISDDNSIHEWPLRVNWRLLLLCQTIVALPLVLLWAILGWRRRRRNRVTALESSL